MKLKSPMNAILLLLPLSLATAPALADHEGSAGAGTALFDRALALNNTVTYSDIEYPVKVSVYRFVDEAFPLANCITVASVRPVEGVDSATDDHHLGVPSVCRWRLDRARAAWGPVDSILSGTRFRFPAVYDAYLSARDALLDLE